MSKCPACGTDGAYVGLNTIECLKSDCKFYDKDLIYKQDSTKSESASETVSADDTPASNPSDPSYGGPGGLYGGYSNPNPYSNPSPDHCDLGVSSDPANDGLSVSIKIDNPGKRRFCSTSDCGKCIDCEAKAKLPWSTACAAFMDPELSPTLGEELDKLKEELENTYQDPNYTIVESHSLSIDLLYKYGSPEFKEFLKNLEHARTGAVGEKF